MLPHIGRKSNKKNELISAPVVLALAFLFLGWQYSQAQPNSGVKTVVIDAGHGGHDGGCHGPANHQEKNLALAMALKTAKTIRANHPDVTVILTRETDVFIPLHQRAAIANRNKADLFISIHCNAMPPGNTGTYGTETYVMGLHTAQQNLNVAKRENEAILLEADYEKNYDFDPYSTEGHIVLSMYQNAFLEQSILFADLVEKNLGQKQKRYSRGVKQAGFVVLKETAMPSVLIETGFLTNANEEQFLATEAGQLKIAGAIAEAFSQYKSQVESGIAPVSGKKIETSATPKEKAILEHHDWVESPSQQYRRGSASSPQSTASSPQSSAYNPQNTVSSPQGTVYTPAETRKPKPETETKAKTVTASTVDSKPMLVTAKSNLESPKAGTASKIVVAVQLAASSKKLNTATLDKWKNLPFALSIIPENGMYKYQVRQASSLAEAEAIRQQLKGLGFPDAFLVAYKNGQKIPIGELPQ